MIQKDELAAYVILSLLSIITHYTLNICLLYILVYNEKKSQEEVYYNISAEGCNKAEEVQLYIIIFFSLKE